MKKVVSRLKSYLKDIAENLRIKRKRNYEVEKYKDRRRVQIYSKVKLTKEQKQKIDGFYVKNYGRKIAYIWHQNFMAHSGKFDEKYFPELLYIPEFEHFMNMWPEYAKTFSDKNVLPELAKSIGVQMPKTILSSTKGLYRDSNLNWISADEAKEILHNAGKVFIKPSVDSCSGRGCFIANFKDGIDILSSKSTSAILESLGIDAVIQEPIKCHDSISRIYSESVNTFRVITYRWRDEILHMPVIMRIGQGGSYLDNAHAGGMFIAIDDDGALHKTAMTEFNDKFNEHPDTKFVFEGQKIELVPKVLEEACKMHTAIPQLGVVNWDFTINESGEPVLIEANLNNGSVWLSEMAHGCGAFGDRTAEVLQWIRFMKKMAKNDRHNYLFGRMKEYSGDSL